ncbi:hypothetical protein QNH48_15430 [Neobacillus sp. YX16]|uniref:hypothetical protein n=1 Tax=Neobacillus sp. YX16 TaxID=3047874 RepID=UPI0024C40E3E|nr:hypothetical protein [Neobacillus sp. YX16]WHZ00469.1 hypothetical protein QNH48_15430 [Neobacillus sp. YX16]
MVYSGGVSLGFQKQNNHGNDYSETIPNEAALITKVILEDKDGTLYSVEPNMN